jgi:tetratricopeptide (TPR) repeat protein
MRWTTLLFSAGLLASCGAGLLAGCGGQAPLAPRAVELNRAGIEALEQGDLATAEARLALALEYHPRFVEALVNLGLTELARGNHDRARALLLRARGINADLPHPHHGLGVLAQRQARPAEAAQHYREALRVDPGFIPARANLGRAYFDAGSLDEAREQFLRLTEVAPDDARGPAGLVETLLRQGRRAEASEQLDRACVRLGGSPALSILVARRDLERGRIDRARLALGRLTAGRDASATTALAWLAVADLAAGDLDQAVAHADEALGRDRFEPVATFALARALEARQDPAASAWRIRVEELTASPR